MLKVFLLHRLKVVVDQLLNADNLPIDFVDFGFMYRNLGLLPLNILIAGNRSLRKYVAIDAMKKDCS